MPHCLPQFQTKIGAYKAPQRSFDKPRVAQVPQRKAAAAHQSFPAPRCSGLSCSSSSSSSSSSWASSCSTAKSSAEVLASKADTASCRTETMRHLTPDTPNLVQKLLGCRLTFPAVKKQLVPDPVLLLRTDMKAEQNETKNKHKLPDAARQKDCQGLSGWREVTITASVSSNGICQPSHEACGLNRWAPGMVAS